MKKKRKISELSMIFFFAFKDKQLEYMDLPMEYSWIFAKKNLVFFKLKCNTDWTSQIMKNFCSQLNKSIHSVFSFISQFNFS